MLKKSSYFNGGVAVAAMGLALLAMPAHAQDTTTDSTEAEAPEEEKAIIVTGSRIRRPNLESNVPVTSLGGEDFFKQGQTNIGDTLNELPQLRSTFSQQNPGAGIGIAGLNLLDLRGLGTQRTLVLVNGRRHVPADILNNAVSVDTNTIPNDLVERVDIVTGGNSAIYGSDAIAGVVNFVLRRDYDGLQLRASVGAADAGFGGNQYISAMYGKNFADGRANVTVHGEYSRADRVFASDVPAFQRNNGFGVVDVDANLPVGNNGGDGFPDRMLFQDFRSTTIHYNGLIPINQQNAANGRCGNATSGTNGGPNAAGVAFSCNYIFSDDGRLVPLTGTRFGSGVNSSIVGGNGQTGREGKTLSVLPFTERYNFNVLSHFEISPAAELFVEGKWNRVNALGNNAGPSFIQGQQTQFDFRERTRLDNPFLNPADRTTLANAILTANCRTDLSVVCPAGGNLTATDVANINNGSYRFVIARNLLDVGLRDEKFQRDTWRVVGGLRGTFNDDWSYELSANYGKFREDITTNGYIDRQRFVLAMDAGRNPATGQIQCRAQFDPASALPIQRTDPVSVAIAQRNAARLAADIAACVPYNPFGSQDNKAAVNYFSRSVNNKSGLSQFVLSGFVSGDTSGLVELPGGPVRFAVGAEYRREKAFYDQDPFVTDGFTNGVSIPTFRPKAFEVKEAYGEIQIPLIKETPFFHELTLLGAARVAKYQGVVGTVWSYNAGVDWAPIEDIRFRANYGRAVRAPNVSETSFPLVPNFANSFSDPCNPANIGSGIRKTNCEADLGALLPALTNITQSLPIVSGSNPDLEAETSSSLTLGAVIQPRFIRGLNLSVDYYDIKVKNIITSLSAQTIVNSCYDSATLDNIFCQQFERWRGPGLGPNGEIAGRLLGNSLVVAPLNFAKRERRGIDVNLSYRTNITDDVRFNTNLIWTHNLKKSDYQDPTNPNFENRILSELGDPKNEFRWDVDLATGPFTVGYRMRYIGPMYVTAYEDLFSLNGLPAGNADYADILTYPKTFYHDLRLEWDIKGTSGPNMNLYVGADNILNTAPPLGSTATGAGSSIYSFRGRTFYAGVRARF